MTELTITPYTAADREAVYHIAADTAFLGEPVEAFLDDRRLFCEAFYAYYTEIEPEHGWVARAGDEVAGFLMGCTDTARRERLWVRTILPHVLGQALRGRYRLGRRTWRYAASFLLGALRGELPQADGRMYPAHLHINVDARWRGQGLGSRLMMAYLGQLRALRVPGVHLHTTNLNAAACRLYVRFGFQLLTARPTQVWKHLVARAVENRCYGLRLA